MHLLLSCYADRNDAAIHGNDFNAVLGAPLKGDDVEYIRLYGAGDRKIPETKVALWNLQHGGMVQSRMNNANRSAHTWTWCRSMDGALILKRLHFSLFLFPSPDHIIWFPISYWFQLFFNHRSVHFKLKTRGRRGKKLHGRSNFKGWRPEADQNNNPTKYEYCIRPLLAASMHGSSKPDRFSAACGHDGRKRRPHTCEQNCDANLYLSPKLKLRQWKSQLLSYFVACW